MTVNFAKNIILYGPPGTGKTYNSVNYAVAICENKDVEEVKLQDYEGVMQSFKKLVEDGRIVFTTFHQSYGYEEFIEGIEPVIPTSSNQEKTSVGESGNQESNEIGYRYKKGIFKDLCDRARETLDKYNEGKESAPAYVIVIDEINRGNISKIFGELITLIEESKRLYKTESMEAKLPYTQEDFGVPENVYIIGTMNTADRSIALMDTALRRRFQFVEMMPKSDILKEIEVEGIRIDEMLEKINARIEYLYDREHTIGHALFMGLKDNPSINKLAEIFQKSIIPLLQEYFYEDYDNIMLVLGDNNTTDSKKQFIYVEEKDFSKVFKGTRPDYLQPTKKVYKINDATAFKNPESYKKIYQ